MTQAPQPEGSAKEPPLLRTVAAIDIGSNAVRMEIAEVLTDARIEVLERAHRAVRLGQDTFAQGRLQQRTMNAAVGILRDCRSILETYQVRHVRAVATSAVREASNGDTFLDRIYMATNIDVEVIDPSEESRLTVGAVRHAIGEALGVLRGRALIADVGGGSALLTFLDRGEIVSSGSYRLGSIRLQEVLDTSREPPDRAADLLRHQVAGTIATIKASVPMHKARLFVAVGGDARFAARRIGRPAEAEGLFVIGAKEFDAFVDRCVGHSAESLAREFGLPFADAETLVPALISYQSLLRETRARRIIVPPVSMRDGLLGDLARRVTGQDTPEMEEGVLQSARAIGERYHYDAAHSQHVAELALTLFDALASEHRLSSRHRLLLRVAALLHEVGNFVSSRSHHKHSYYLVANSEIFGLRREELAVVAHVARYHRRSAPKPTHVDYMGLPRETRMVVNKLAAILRVADALEKTHTQHICDIGVEVHDSELLIHVRHVADLDLERRALALKGGMFEDVYGLRVRLEEADAYLERSRRDEAARVPGEHA
jgi:exopolyphosphatase/guanosine-5'-triphosphate,3'-diphosphate pyrophosphatase